MKTEKMDCRRVWRWLMQQHVSLSSSPLFRSFDYLHTRTPLFHFSLFIFFLFPHPVVNLAKSTSSFIIQGRKKESCEREKTRGGCGETSMEERWEWARKSKKGEGCFIKRRRKRMSIVSAWSKIAVEIPSPKNILKQEGSFFLVTIDNELTDISKSCQTGEEDLCFILP